MRQGEHGGPTAARRAFTLVEAVFVSVIIAMIGAMALPRYGSYVASQQTQAAARRVLSDLMYAQRQSRITSSSQQVMFDVGKGTYELTDAKDPDRQDQVYRVDLGTDPYRATITSASFGGDSIVVFDGYGTPDTPGTVTVRVGKYSQTISLDGGFTRPRITGKVSIEAIE